MSADHESPLPSPEKKSEPDIAVKSLGIARFFVVLGVLASVVLAAALYLSTVIQAVHGIYNAYVVEQEDITKALLYLAVAQADGLLVATALLITGFGLYSLFIGRPETLPKWLQIESIDELKQKLIGVVVAALAVDYFSTVYEGQNTKDLLTIGVGTGAMIAALGYFLSKNRH